LDHRCRCRPLRGPACVRSCDFPFSSVTAGLSPSGFKLRLERWRAQPGR
jgi:hypothetical protein